MVDPDAEDLKAAHDYRSQMQQRYGQVASGLHDQIEANKPELFAHLLKVFPDLSEEDIAILFSRSVQDTPWDDGLSHAYIYDYKQRIERSAILLGYDLKGGVSAGFLNSDGIEAMQQSVMMTTASVVMVAEHLLTLCVRASKLIAKSWPYEVIGEKFRLCEEPAEVQSYLYENREIQNYWNEFFFDYAVNPKRPSGGPLLASTGREENTFWGDLSEAMSLFILGHEYGHHIAEHRVGGSLSVDGEDIFEAHRKELQADHIAAEICAESGADMEEPNFFAVTNVGAVCVLICLEYLRRAQRILATGDDGNSDARDTHPPLRYRLMMVRDTTAAMLGGNTATSLKMHDQFVGFLDFIWHNVRPQLVKLHVEGVRAVSVDEGGWLPR